MEEQKDQRPTSSATARPQQPANCYVAALPPETLAQIFDLALGRLDPWARQKARLELAKTCIGWYESAELGRGLVVKDSYMALRLRDSLEKGSVERRAAVRSLKVDIELHSIGKYKRVAPLIASCLEVESIELGGEVLDHSRRYKSAALVEPLMDALKRTSKVKEFSIKNLRDVEIAPGALFELYSSWPQLHSVTLENIWTCQLPTRGQQLPALPPFPLTRLEVPISPALLEQELPHILVAASETLRHLLLHPSSIQFDAFHGIEISAQAFEPIAAIAPQLVTLIAVVECDIESPDELAEYWWPTLSALRDVQRLEIGASGYKLGAILPLLQRLPRLATLSISSDFYLSSDRAVFRQFTSCATLDFIAQAPMLQSLTLPARLREDWTVGELCFVQATADEKGVEFELK